MHSARRAAVVPQRLRYEENDALIVRRQREQEDAKYFWFDSSVRPEGACHLQASRYVRVRVWWLTDVYTPDASTEVLEASDHPPKYEMSVTGRKRIKPGSRTVTVGGCNALHGFRLLTCSGGAGATASNACIAVWTNGMHCYTVQAPKLR